MIWEGFSGLDCNVWRERLASLGYTGPTYPFCDLYIYADFELRIRSRSRFIALCERDQGFWVLCLDARGRIDEVLACYYGGARNVMGCEICVQ
jgi:hypothetical protein